MRVYELIQAPTSPFRTDVNTKKTCTWSKKFLRCVKFIHQLKRENDNSQKFQLIFHMIDQKREDQKQQKDDSSARKN